MKPSEEDFDLDLVKKTILEQLMEEMSVQKREAYANISSNEDDNLEFEGQANLESAMEQYFNDLEAFYQDVSDKITLFDPLDRVIPEDGDDQTTKRDAVISIINNLQGVVGQSIENKLSYAQERKFKDLQLDAKYQIIDLAERMSHQAKIQGEAFNKDFKKEKLFKLTHLAFQFFTDHKLVSNADEMLEDFLSFARQ